MRRLAAPAGLAVFVASVVVVVEGGCASPFIVCASDEDCPSGTRCDAKAGACVDDAAGAARTLRIARVDGTGSALPVGGRDVPAGERAEHRLRDAIVVVGDELDTVTAATLADASHHFDLEFVVDDGEHMRLSLPQTIAPGLFTLTLVSAAATAHADVFLLQGEPGPATLFKAVDAPVSSCPSGGVRYEGGVDANRNGALDDAEIDAALTRDLCNGDSIFTCDAAQSCTTTRALAASSLKLSSLDVDTITTASVAAGTITATTSIDAPAITVAGTPVQTHITAPVTVQVPGDAATVTDALALFGGVALDADVTIAVAAGTFDEPGVISVTRPDFAHVKIVGAGSTATTLRFTNASGLQADLDGQIGLVAQLTVRGNDNPGTDGVLAQNGGRLRTGADVVVSHFGTAAVATRNGELEIAHSVLINNVNGVIAVDGGYVDATGANASANTNGFIAVNGAVIEAPSCVASGNFVAANNGGVALDAANESVVIGTSCSLTGNGTAVALANESTISADHATFAGNVTNFSVSVNSSARRDLATGDPTLRAAADSTSIIVP